MSKAKNNGDRLPPHSVEAEAGVLSCVFQAPYDTLNSLTEWRVGVDWFYDSSNAIVFNGMMHLHERREQPVDMITLRQHLKETNQLEQIGGLPFLNHLHDAAPSAANLRCYVDIVRDKHLLRKLAATCTEICGLAMEHQGNVNQLLADASSRLETLTDALLPRGERHIKEVLLNEVIPQVEDHYTRGRQQLRGLSTHLTYLDKIIRGIRNNYYFVVAARPGDGKTSFGMHLVKGMTAAGLAVGVFTLEMTADSLATRLLFDVADVNSGNFEQGYATKDDFNKLTTGVATLAQRQIWLDADPDQTIEMIAAKARRMVREHGIKLFVLDYLQLLDDEGNRDRVQALRKISKKIVSLKNKLNVPWLVLAQMNRNIETSDVRRVPVLSDLKECGAIEQDADVVMFLYPPLKLELEDKDGMNHNDAIAAVMNDKGIKDRMDWPRRVNAAVAKNRYGPTGMAQLLFEKNRCRWHDWRDFALAHNLKDYGAGERRAQNPEEQSDPEDE